MTANQSTQLKTTAGITSSFDIKAAISTLESAADLFIRYEENTVKIWASSRDWFTEEWGRDTFISLPGLLLSTQRYDEARQIFLRFAHHEKKGLIPNRIREGEIEFNTVDGSLWLIHALKEYVRATDDWGFVSTMMPTVRNIISGYTHGTGFRRGGQEQYIGMDKDGLVISPSQATWMDADSAGDGSQAVTPRNGKCVEINALWYGALRFVAAAEQWLHPYFDTTELDARARLVKQSFYQKFWNEEAGCLYDVVEGDPHTAAVRPNQIFAISHGLDLIDPDTQSQILSIVERELLTAGGLRTLSPKDPLYHGHYDTFDPIPVKDLAYHQGTVWPWLLGSYCDALKIVREQQFVSSETIQREILGLVAPLAIFCMESEFTSLPEVFSGDEPFEPGGTTSQAWSVAEVLRTLKSISEVK